jgi:hypothetical protein
MKPTKNLDYMRDMAGELAQIARSNGFDELGFIFAMAELEAEVATPTHHDAYRPASLVPAVPASAANE